MICNHARLKNITNWVCILIIFSLTCAQRWAFQDGFIFPPLSFFTWESIWCIKLKLPQSHTFITPLYNVTSALPEGSRVRCQMTFYNQNPLNYSFGNINLFSLLQLCWETYENKGDKIKAMRICNELLPHQQNNFPPAVCCYQ